MRWVTIVSAFSLLVGCGAGTPADSQQPGTTTGVTELPPPATSGSFPLERALATRRSIRDFSSEPLAQEAVSQLLWAAQGVTSSGGKRTAPSAGALYPLELYVADVAGLHRYLPETHELETRGAADLRAALADAALGQASIADAAVVFIVTGVQSRTEEQYGARADRYVQLEAGHAAQNLLLQAVALELGAVPVGAFGDLEVRRVLGLPPEEEPLYLIAVGHPAGAEQ